MPLSISHDRSDGSASFSLLIGLVVCALVLVGCQTLAESITLPSNSKDCLAIQAESVAVTADGDGTYTITDGQSQMLSAASREDAEDMATLARRHEKQCFIGRDNQRADRDAYVTEYWVGRSSVDAAPLPQSDCVAYDPEDLRIVDEGADGYLLTDGASRMLLLDTRSDAERALAWAQQHSKHCFIGRDNQRPNREQFITEFWAGPGLDAESSPPPQAGDPPTNQGDDASDDTAVPQQFRLLFSDVTLAFTPGAGSPQIAAENYVLSYGDRWEVEQVKPFLFHVRRTSWNDFFWKVNTSRETVYRVEGGTFGDLGGTEQELNLAVDPSGSPENPSNVILRLPDTRLLYDPAQGPSSAAAGPQVLTGDDVLTYRHGWEVNQLKPYLYHVRRTSWDNFFWKVNTSRKQAFVVEGGTFGQFGGQSDLLPTSVEVDYE